MGAIETLNGSAPSWANASITFDITGAASVEDVDMAGLTFEVTVERGEQRGQGGRLKKHTDGQSTPTASMSLYQDGMRALKRGLMAAATAANLKDPAGRLQLAKVQFNIIVTHSMDGDPDIHTHKILGCKLAKDAMALAEGSDANKVECDLHPVQIVEIIDGVETVML
jgi:hypothetical protein